MPASPTPAHDRTRYFILNLGRSGSSLLAAILADAGANFGLQTPTTWDPRRGEMEGRAIKRAAHHYRRAYDISCGRKYFLSPRLEGKLRLRRGRKYLAVALKDSRFVKIGDLDLVVQPSFKLGFIPRVILNYRQLEASLPSLLVGRTHVGPDELAGEYVRIYRQGLVLLQTFGGCTVGYNELQDPDATKWAKALAATTGLDRQLLLDSRDKRLNSFGDAEQVEPVYNVAFDLYEQLRRCSGEFNPPSRQVERAIAARA